MVETFAHKNYRSCLHIVIIIIIGYLFNRKFSKATQTNRNERGEHIL